MRVGLERARLEMSFTLVAAPLPGEFIPERERNGELLSCCKAAPCRQLRLGRRHGAGSSRLLALAMSFCCWRLLRRCLAPAGLYLAERFHEFVAVGDELREGLMQLQRSASAHHTEDGETVG